MTVVPEASPPQASVTAPPAPPSARRRAVRGSIWTVGGYAVAQFLRLASNIVLSRLLAPEYFGLMSIVNALLLGLEMFSDLGIAPSIIQHPRGDEPDFRNTAWTLQAVRGVILASCAALLAPLATGFYQQPQLMWLLPAAGATALIAGANSTALASAQRRLDLGRITLLDVIAQFTGVMTMIGWAWMRPTVWALVIGPLTTAMVKMLGSHVLQQGPANRWRWEPQARTALLHFGKWIFLSTIITFCAVQTDRLILGKLVPMATVGVYSMALAIAQIPNLLLGLLSRSIILPLLARHAHSSTAELLPRLTAARETLLRAGLVLVLGLFLEADLFFRLLYDSRYFAAGGIAQWMAPWIWLALLATTIETALLALGDTRSLAVANLARFVGTACGSVAGYYTLGLPGFILGLAVGALAGHAATLAALWRHGIWIIGQDVQYTVTLVALAGGGVLLERWLPAEWGLFRELPVAMYLLVVMVWQGLPVRGQLWPDAQADRDAA